MPHRLPPEPESGVFEPFLHPVAYRRTGTREEQAGEEEAPSAVPPAREDLTSCDLTSQVVAQTARREAGGEARREGSRL